MKYTNKYNLPASIAEAIIKNTYDLQTKNPKVISITGLISPPRIRQLSLRYWDKLEEDISNNIWQLLGSATHEIIARINKDNRIIEERIGEEINGITVSGKADLYDGKELSIPDYKITSVWAVKQLKPEWEQQGNGYAWLYRKMTFEVKSAYINAILKDWRKSELLRYGNDYPPIPYKKLDIPLWTFEKQQAFIEERVNIHKQAIDLADNNLPLCTKEERWATEDKWAVYKNKNKTASKVCDSEKQAIDYQGLQDKKHTWHIEKRTGEDKRCPDYCPVNLYCNYYKEKQTKKESK